MEKNNHLFPDSTQWFLSGRSALKSIIRDIKNCHTIAMPSWCCDSMVKPFTEAGFEIYYYPVYWQNGLIQDIHLDSDVLFLLDYFGYTAEQPDLRGYKGIIIRDLTHSLFSKTYSDADYYFGSLRKWCGVWTGGYAWTKDNHKLAVECSNDHTYISLRERAMIAKYRYISGINLGKKEYLKLFEEAEECLDQIIISPGAERDVRLAEQLDIKGIKQKRRKNAEVLRSAFSDWLIFDKMNSEDCPMFVPILVPNGKRNELKQYLIEKDIFCPVHWPVNELNDIVKETEQIYNNEISLVCDQRYTETDMNRIVTTVNDFWRRKR